MKLRGKFYCAIDDLRYIFIKEKFKILLFLTAFIIGLICGLVLFEGFISIEWLVFTDGDTVIFIVTETNFFVCLFRVFWKFCKMVICLFILSLFRHTPWVMLVFALLNGISFGVISVILIESYGIIGAIYIIIFLIEYLFLLALIFLSFCFARNNFSGYKMCDKYAVLELIKFFSLTILLCFLTSLAINILVFLVLRTLFSVA